MPSFEEEMKARREKRRREAQGRESAQKEEAEAKSANHTATPNKKNNAKHTVVVNNYTIKTIEERRKRR